MKKSVLLFVFIPFFIVQTVRAVDPNSVFIPTPTPISPDSIGVEYTLPYPGILPTHPLYFLKNLRDRIIEFLITDSIRKGEFYILQADKKVGMARVLDSEGKTSEARQAYADAVTNRTQAVEVLEKYVQDGGNIPGYIQEKMRRSLAKHREVTTSFQEQTALLDALSTRIDTLSD